MEHRCGHRRTVTAPVTVRTRNGLAAEGEVCNLSASGALLRTHLPLRLHTHVLIQFSTAHSDGRVHRSVVAGEVVRLVKDGFAVEWAEFSPMPLRELMRRLSEPTAAVTTHRKRVHTR